MKSTNDTGSFYDVEDFHQEDLFEHVSCEEDAEDTKEEEVIEGESKSDAFKRITGPRINNIVNELRKLSNAANTRRYEYSKEEVQRMFDYIDIALEKTKSMYTKEKVFLPKFKW